MGNSYRYIVTYYFKDQPREFQLELAQSVLTAHAAALHLLQLHFGDAENNLIMPSSDASPDAILDQARLLGISGICYRPVS